MDGTVTYYAMCHNPSFNAMNKYYKPALKKFGDYTTLLYMPVWLKENAPEAIHNLSIDEQKQYLDPTWLREICLTDLS